MRTKTVVVLAGMFAGAIAHAQEPAPAPAPAPLASAEKTSRYGLSGGFLLPGSFYIGDPVDDYFDTEMSLMLRGLADWKVADKITAGFYGQFVNVSYDETYGADVPDQLIEAGGALRFVVQAAPALFIRPGIELGYRTVTGGDDLDDISGMALNASVEIELRRPNGITPYLNTGFITQPTGGNEDVDVTWGPILHLTGGIVF